MAQYDIIFAGGGTTACVTASRLAAADPTLKILILEAGPSTTDNPTHTQPARYISHLGPDSTTVKPNLARPSQYLGGRSIIVPCGQCLGGGSSVNCKDLSSAPEVWLTTLQKVTMYTRASASDYDDWETKYGNPGWGCKDLIPLLKKVETFEVKSDQDTHGYSGPLKVSLNRSAPNIAQDFLDTTSVYDPSRKTTDDPNALFSCDEYARWPRWIGSKNGRRSDVPHHFLYPLLGKTRLEVKTGILVKRIVIENGHATGVEYMLNKRFHPDGPTGVNVVHASRLVVVSAGAFGSPAILERSGIGGRATLEKFGIDVRVDLPGVGEGYEDHNMIYPAYKASQESSTLDKFFFGNDENEVARLNSVWEKDGGGLIASNGLDAGIKLRPNVDELKAIGPAFDARWKEFFVPAPDKPVMWLGPIALNLGGAIQPTDDKFFCILSFLGYPSAVGQVHITSGEDVYAPTDFDPGYLQHDDDLALLVWAYKRGREIARRMKCYRGEHPLNHPAFSRESSVACQENIQPVPIDAPELQYSAEDDEVIKDYVRAFLSTTWHSLGTCSMKPREVGGVVDSALNVYGVKNLKVADMSIAPGNVGSNTYSTALTIGEKAAIIIASELGISGVL
ncbi:hypothetical protein NLI96_g11573 [Meripilus lineatus]|uniref:Glucose-methanol-choline oxidoreductase N-terminal domain-containing protein n=1 Tax=Meripilus lineatus TaxID=2056292 RepID=A0AAD5UTZ1_9APHY|nr:hypothetical protein NLI96_g11573 [Physisporinus lineatus]